MKIKVVSDIHIGIPGSNCNDCHFTDDQIFAFLTKSCENHDNVILNGDIFECWESSEAGGHGFESQLKQLKNISVHFPKTIKLINTNDKIVLIYGNHDIILNHKNQNTLTKVKETFTATEHDFTIHFAHGHRGDTYNKNYNFCGYTFEPIGRFLSYLSHLGELYINKNMEHHLIAIQKTIMPAHDDSQIKKHAINIARNKKYNMVVFGHTHNSEISMNELRDEFKENVEHFYDDNSPVNKKFNKKTNMIYCNSGHVTDYTTNIDELVIDIKLDESNNSKTVVVCKLNKYNVVTNEIYTTHQENVFNIE
jgi:UDP-2,3-diacylglucosamine pyrophosphatase LpxH